MKKLIFIIPIFLILFSSCAPKIAKNLTPSERVVIERFFDYSAFAKEGFMISPDPYAGTFDACGEIHLTILPGKSLKKGKDVFNDSMNKYETNYYLESETIPGQELLRIIVEKAKGKGADAITNFRFKSNSNSYYDDLLRKEITVFLGFELSGFAIKRK